MNLAAKYTRAICLSVAAIALTTTSLPAKPPTPPAPKPKPGKAMLHLHLQKRMVNEGVIAGASGKVDLNLDQHGNKTDQHLHIEVRNLETNATYQLFASADGDTNSASILEFTTDDNGNASIEFRDKGKSENKGHGPIKAPLPDALNPVSGIVELTVSDANQQTVLTADLTAPDKMEYELERDLSADSIKASLKIHANEKHAEVRLEAKGLSPNSQYSLSLNDAVAQTGNTDEHGHLNLKVRLPHALDILSLQSVALLDSTSTAVVSTTLP
jgi:hypothetical protein